MELSLLKITKVQQKIVTWSFWTLLVPDSFNLYIMLFYIAIFLNLLLWIYTDMASTKYWSKRKNIIED